MTDTTDNLCPICGEPVEEGEPWALVDGEAVHERCESDAMNNHSAREACIGRNLPANWK